MEQNSILRYGNSQNLNEYYWYGGNEIMNDSIIFHIPLHIMQPTVQTNVEYVILNIPMKRLFASDQDAFT